MVILVFEKNSMAVMQNMDLRRWGVRSEVAVFLRCCSNIP